MRLPPGKKQLYEVVWRIREIRDPPKDYLKEPIKGPEHFAQTIRISLQRSGSRSHDCLLPERPECRYHH